MSSILFIHGGDSFARQVFQEEGRGYWSAAFSLVLEKYGFFVDVADGPERLHDWQIWQRYDAVLVARLPPGAWTAESAAAAADGRAGVMVEGPLPEEFAERLGVRVVEPPCHDGILSTIDPDLHGRASAYGYAPSARIQGGTSTPVPRRPEMNWTSIPAVPIGADQARAWRVRGWDTTGLEVVAPDARVVADWSCAEGGARGPAVVKRGGLVGACFTAFAYAAQRHTSEPYEGAEHRTNSRAAGLEVLILALIDELHAHAGAPRARVMPWPVGIAWVRNVRHDFDRPLPAERVADVLAGHHAAGSAGTWYWRARHVSSDALSLVAGDDTQEVALHTERLWISAEEERHAIEQAIGHPVAGASAHGDPNCFRYQGAPNVLWAEAQGLLYTELVQQAHFLPHRFPALESDGTVRALDVICLPHHESLDRSTTPGDTYAENLARVAPAWVKAGGFMQILNHPDINREELFTLLAGMPDEGRDDWSAEQAARWWRTSHVAGELQLRRLDAGGFRVSSRAGVKGLVIELRNPDGELERFVHDLDPGQEADVRAGRPEEDLLEAASATREARRAARRDRAADAEITGAESRRLAALRAPAAVTRTPTWGEVMPMFAEEVRRYLFVQGRDANEDTGAQSTINTNSTLVPKRGDDLVRLILALTAVDDLTHLRVLEVGTGWGSLATYLTLAYHPREFVGLDVRPDFVEAARKAVDGFEIPGLSFTEGDMHDLRNVPDGSADLILANNAFIYLPTQREQMQALKAFRRVLAPGGHVVLYHANRWVWREPFTGSPAVHLLPPMLARRVAGVFGWKHNVGRVRYPSPFEMRRMLLRAGFRRVRYGAPRGKAVNSGPGSRFSRFYGIGAGGPGRGGA